MHPSQKFLRLGLAFGIAIMLSVVALGQPDNSIVQVSDQKGGSMIVFPYYASGIAGAGGGDTRMTISNVDPAPFFTPVPPGAPLGAAATAQTINVHLFFLDATCAPADTFLCLTPYASFSFKASEYDPFTTRGALYALVVDSLGNPIAYNGLIGNAFVNYTDPAGRRFVGNYAAESFFAIGVPGQIVGPNGLPSLNFYPAVSNGVTAALPLNNGPRRGLRGYDGAATRFAIEIQSPLDARDQTIATVGLSGVVGDTITGAGQVGVGTVINGDEKPFGSFTGFTGGCISQNVITATNPRVPQGLNNVIPSGQVGTVTFNVQAAVGLLMTPQAVGAQPNAWYGIRTLHKLAVTDGAVLVVPVFIPAC